MSAPGSTHPLMSRLLTRLSETGTLTVDDVKQADPYGVAIGPDGEPFIVETKRMARYACINGGNVVQQVVVWDGAPSWAPPAGQTPVLIPDSLFVEQGGTLDPVTLVFVRATPPVLDPENPVVIRSTLNIELVKILRSWGDDADAAVAAWDGWTTAQRFAALKIVVQRFGNMSDRIADLLITLYTAPG